MLRLVFSAVNANKWNQSGFSDRAFKRSDLGVAGFIFYAGVHLNWFIFTCLLGVKPHWAVFLKALQSQTKVCGHLSAFSFSKIFLF